MPSEMEIREAQRKQKLGEMIDALQEAGLIDTDVQKEPSKYELMVEILGKVLGVPEQKDDHVRASKLQHNVIGPSAFLYGIPESVEQNTEKLWKETEKIVTIVKDENGKETSRKEEVVHAIDEQTYKENLLDVEYMKSRNEGFYESTMGDEGYRSEQLVTSIGAIANTDKQLMEAMNPHKDNIVVKGLKRLGLKH